MLKKAYRNRYYEDIFMHRCNLHYSLYVFFKPAVYYKFSKPAVTVKLGATDLLNNPYYSMLGGSKIGGFYYVSLLMNIVKL